MSPPRPHSLLAIVTALMAALVLVCLVVSQPSDTRATAPAHPSAPGPQIGAGGAWRHVILERPLAPALLRLTPALARAYAAAGELRDGQAHACDHLDQATLDELAHADELLAMTVAIPGTRLPTRLPDGSVLQMGDPAASSPTLAGASSRVQAPAAGQPAAASATTGAHATTADGDLAPAASIGSADAAGAVVANAVAHDLVAGGRVPMPIQGDLIKQLIAPDAWVAIPYHPAQVGGKPLIILNASSGDYAVALYGSDFGSVRLDGGLIVPGRFYRISGRACITSQVPVVVHIRPLQAVGPYYPHALQVPSADG